MSEPLDSQTQADVRAGYAAAIQLVAYEGAVTWHVVTTFLRFATLLVGGAVFPSFIGVNNLRVIALVTTAFSVVGIVATFMWWSMTDRNRQYQRFWFANAREFEKRLPAVKTTTSGKCLADGDTCWVGDEKIMFTAIQRFTFRFHLTLFYLAFLATFFVLFCFNIVRLVKAF